MPYFNPAQAESLEQHYVKVAADLVARWAPAPNPESADYAVKAARAERLVYNWLTQTSGGVVSSKSLSGVGSKSLDSKGLGVARGIVREAMGAYYKSDVAYVGAFDF